jgi:hypothetical protein
MNRNRKHRTSNIAFCRCAAAGGDIRCSVFDVRFPLSQIHGPNAGARGRMEAAHEPRHPMSGEPLRSSADIPVCGFTGHSCPVLRILGTGKPPVSRRRRDWKACATSRFISDRARALWPKTLAGPEAGAPVAGSKSQCASTGRFGCSFAALRASSVLRLNCSFAA